MKVKIKQTSKKTIRRIIRKYNLNVWDHYRNDASTSLIYVQELRPILFAAKAKVGGRIAGWVVVYLHNECHFFVLPDYRQKGIGKRLDEFRKRHFSGEITVYPWDGRSRSFFRSRKLLKKS